MTHSTTERIDFGNQVLPANWSLAMERHLEEGWRRGAQTVSQCQRVSPLFKFSAIRRSARIGFRERVLSLKKDGIKSQKALSGLRLLIELAITLFTAGVVVPSLLRSGVSTINALAERSLHTINISGVTFSYTYENVGFAILGSLAGATAAFALASPSAKPKSTASRETVRHSLEMARQAPSRGKSNLR